MDCRKLYGENANEQAVSDRYCAITEEYRRLWGSSPEAFFSSPGRAEIIGNHTDHNGGKVIVAAITCDIVAAVGRRRDGIAEIRSKGFRPVRFRLADTSPHRSEFGRSPALARGVAEGLRRKGIPVAEFGGFSAYTESTVFRGAGVSSSAAFEILIAEIFNRLFLDGRLSPGEKAAAGQFAENKYFGKPCGLLDQSGVAYGGLNEMDFKDVNRPFVAPLPVPNGYSLVLVNTGGSHAGLTSHYADIRREMASVAAFFGKNILREVNEKSFWESLPRLRKKVHERAILRAAHFFEESARADRAAAALRKGDMAAFLALLKESGESSQKYLQNCFVPGESVQPVSLALKISERLLKNGGYRLHGGGFAGTVIACVSQGEREEYVREMSRVFGKENVFCTSVRRAGTVRTDFRA